MNRITILAEDAGHEYFLRALVVRLAREWRVSVQIQVRSGREG